MPFANCDLPSLGLSLLKAALQEVGISCDILYLNLRFAARVDYEPYRRICEGEPAVHDLLGEWIFSEALWGKDDLRDNRYLEQVLRGEHPDHYKATPDELSDFAAAAASLRNHVEPFMEEILSTIPWQHYGLVGFSSTFQQQLASLSLSSRLKHVYPDMTIVFGGANCEGVLGRTLLENFPFIDAVCLGEGDLCFPPYVASVINGSTWEPDPLLLTRHAVAVPSDARSGRQTLVQNMDQLPFADFSDYFRQLQESPIVALEPKIVFESSRGCWWGEKSQCTFCGLNGDGMQFRQKSPERVWQEILWLANQYGSITRSYVASDNIMPRSMLHDVLPRLKELNLNLFYETKSNLKLADVQMFSESGISSVQPGIESLSTRILKLMRKGVNGLQNVQTLKFCREVGVTPTWNYLMGFPGEETGDYEGQADWIRSLHHLVPPQYCGPIRIDRFSPYFRNPEDFGLGMLEPYWSYHIIYAGVPATELKNLAYFFTSPSRKKVRHSSHIRELASCISEWKLQAPDAALRLFDIGGKAFVLDSRDRGAPIVHELSNVEHAILVEIDFIQKISNLAIKLSTTFSPKDIEDGLTHLKEMRLLLSENERYLGLVILARSRADSRPRAEEQAELLPILVS